MEIEINDDIFLDCYRHLVGGNFYDVEFLYGGRDSGKSRHIAMQLLVDCMGGGYFRCLIVRKVLNTVRDSQYSLIRSLIEEWGLVKYFDFNESRMEIVFSKNGNGFFGRGLDDAARIKSFNNPSHCWIEEGNQISAEDFVVVLTSLRASVDVKTWFSFNPECDVNYTDFWLWQDWFSHTHELSWVWNKEIETEFGVIPFRVRATHSTYRDNRYCKPQRKALYESYKGSKNNLYWYQVYTLGLWGFRKTGGEYWKCFDQDKHVIDCKVVPGTFHVSVDNNINPYISIQVWQVDVDGKELRQVHEIACRHPANTASKAAKELVNWLYRVGNKEPVFLYGDPSSNAKSTVDDSGRSFFDKFLSVLGGDFNVISRILRKAPEVAQRGAFINEIYESNYLGWRIKVDPSCKVSVEDYIMVKEDKDGKMLKRREMDKLTGVVSERYGHMSDAKAYFITSVLASEFKQYNSRNRRGRSFSVRNP